MLYKKRLDSGDVKFRKPVGTVSPTAFGSKTDRRPGQVDCSWWRLFGFFLPNQDHFLRRYRVLGAGWFRHSFFFFFFRTFSRPGLGARAPVCVRVCDKYTTHPPILCQRRDCLEMARHWKQKVASNVLLEKCTIKLFPRLKIRFGNNTHFLFSKC